MSFLYRSETTSLNDGCVLVINRIDSPPGYLCSSTAAWQTTTPHPTRGQCFPCTLLNIFCLHLVKDSMQVHWALKTSARLGVSLMMVGTPHPTLSGLCLDLASLYGFHDSCV